MCQRESERGSSCSAVEKVTELTPKARPDQEAAADESENELLCRCWPFTVLAEQN